MTQSVSDAGGTDPSMPLPSPRFRYNFGTRCSAYYWLRMAEENSRELRQRTRALTEELKSKMKAEELETLEHSVMAAVEHNKRLTTKQPVEFIKRSTASASLRVAI